jgi:hypothetical protein
MVLTGEVEFRQAGSSLNLSEGDSLTFSLSQGYRLAGHRRFRSSLLLMLKSERDLPHLAEAPFREVADFATEAPAARSEFQGPLRLVAMRAARTAERGR